MGHTTYKNIYIYIYTYIYIHTHICNRSRKWLNTQRAETFLKTRDPHHLTSSWPSWKLFTSSRPLVAAKNAPKQTRRCVSLQQSRRSSPHIFKKSTHQPAVPHPSDARDRLAATARPRPRMLSINPSIRQSNCSHALMLQSSESIVKKP